MKGPAHTTMSGEMHDFADFLLLATEHLKGKEETDAILRIALKAAIYAAQTVNPKFKAPDSFLTKRELTRIRKESADLWVALTDLECQVNLIIESLLNHRHSRGVALTIQESKTLEATKERLAAYDRESLVAQGEIFVK